MGRGRMLASWMVVLGCAGAPADGGTGDGTGDATSPVAGTAEGSSGPGVPGPPVVVDVGFDDLRLREGESVVLTAVVFDPDDDVTGVELFREGDPEPFGALMARPSDRWRIELGWAEVHQRWSLDFEQRLELPLLVRARDGAGLEAEGSTVLTIVCGGLRDTACGGACVDVQIDPAHCDGCGLVCSVVELAGGSPSGGCLGGRCQPRWSECFEPTVGVGCTDRCAVQGARCAPGGCDGRTTMSYVEAGACEQGQAGELGTAGCDDDLGGRPGAAAMRCCCGD